MGNTPSQEPFESDSQEGTEAQSGVSLTTRVVRAARSFVASCRQRLTSSPSLTVDTVFGRRTGRSSDDDVDDAESDAATPETPDTVEYRSVDDIPDRDQPFAYPASNCDDENRPDLQATESDDELAVYYPNCPGATIESDTWERVER